MTIDLMKAPDRFWQAMTAWLRDPAAYGQLLALLLAVTVALLLAAVLRRRIAALRAAPADGTLLKFRRTVFAGRHLLLPVLLVFLLGVAAELLARQTAQNWLIHIAQSVALIFLLVTAVERFVASPWIVALTRWVGVPVAALHVFGWLDDVTAYLDGISLEVGNIHVSLYALLRTLVFGSLLFWLGRHSNAVGKEAIRSQRALDAGTREVLVKLFEIGIYLLIGLLVLQVMGINLTALAVFGGALGVGLGFGLQQIASNFISGLIILIDRSITIGDYIELEDGRAGTLSELNMRYAVLKTFDGKEIMVPNEKFITTSFVNWTHDNSKQRYSLTFAVSYATDLDQLLPLIREVVSVHPKVIAGPGVDPEELPDAEIRAFGDSGIEILVEFWMSGIDDGRNRVGADLLLAIWRALREHHVEIPFPQREVRILREGSSSQR